MAVGGLLVGASPAMAGEPQADGMIKLEGDAAFRGDNVYNGTGEGQTRTVSAHRGEVVRFRVRAQNDAVNSGEIGLDGTGGETGFRVRYFLGSTDITNEIANGPGHVETLASGDKTTVTLEVKVRASAPNGNFVVGVEAEDPGEDDQVRARIKVS